MRCSIFPISAVILLLFSFFSSGLSAQMVIGGSTPSPSAILDLQSTSKGLLPPRMSTVQRNAITSPTKGLILFNTTENRIQINQGEPDAPVWKNLSTGEALPDTGNTNGNILYWNGTGWTRMAAGLNGQVIQLQNGVPTWSGAAFAMLTTDSASQVTSISATVGGNISSDGGGSITARGVAYSNQSRPTLANSVLALGSGTGAFSGQLTSLSASATYYIRAYATNSAGTAYGEERTFTTPAPSVPTLGTQVATGITQSGAISGGNITSDGGSMVTHRGVVYGTVPGPTLSNSFTQNGSGVGSFSSTLSGLAPNTTYYVRAYATNSVGTAYGNEISFITSSSGTGSGTITMKNMTGGTFSRGCTTTLDAVNFDPYCGSVEMPVHTVTLSAFQIGETEVTQADWLTIMESNPSSNTNPACLQCPVENVSWYDAIVFCNRLSEANGLTPCYYKDASYSEPYGKFGSVWYLSNTGDVYWNSSANGYRLPTEAEWEFAARGGSSTNLYSGSNNSNDIAWYNTNSGNKTKMVKLKSPNNMGLYDMSGNVYEWCWDIYGSYPSSSQTDPKGVSVGSDRVFRGGSYYLDVSYCRVAWRLHGFGPGLRISPLGFRLAKTL